MFQPHGEVGGEARDVVFVLVQSDEQVVHGPGAWPAAIGGVSRQL